MSPPVRAVLLEHFPVSAGRVFGAWLDTGPTGRWIFGLSHRDECIVRLQPDELAPAWSAFTERTAGACTERVAAPEAAFRSAPARSSTSLFP